MKIRTRKLRCSSGFSLIELVVVIGVLAILAGVLIPNLGGVSRSGKSQTVLELVSTLRQACLQHHIHTGDLALEYSRTGSRYHMLSMQQTTTGWKGPYLETPLTASQNPYGGQCYVYNVLNPGNLITGFDLDADGTVEVSGAGNVLYLSEVTEDDARDIDASLDKGVAGTWTDTGRVRWNSARSVLLILLFRP